MRSILAWLSIVVVVVVGLFVAWPLQVDDAFITYRYSQNIAHGNGVVWNADDENPTEGYTNFLWMGLMIIPHIFGVSPVFFSKILGIASLLACILVMYLYGYRRTGRPMTGLLAAGFLVLLPSTYFHAVSGMETMFYALIMVMLLILGMEVFRNPLDDEKAFTLGIPILTLLAGLIRPEGVLPGLFVIVVMLLRAPAENRKAILMHTGFGLLLPGLIYFTWRLTYFGYLMPNTFYIKFGNLYDGFKWGISVLAAISPMLVFLVLSYISQTGQSKWLMVLPYSMTFVLLAVLPYLMSSLTMNYLNRFLFHVMPCIFLLLALGFERLTVIFADRFGRQGSWRSVVFIGAGLIICLIPFWQNERQEVVHMTLYGPNLETAHVALAKSLSEAPIPDELKTIAVGDAGAIPYYSGWHAIDFIGLNNPAIAHNPHVRNEYIKSKKPTLLILYSGDGQTLRDFQFGLDPQQFLADYDLVSGVRMFPHYYLNVYVRNDIDPASYSWLTAEVQDVGHKAFAANTLPDNSSGMYRQIKARIPAF